MTEENSELTPQEDLAPTLNTTPTTTNTNQIQVSNETYLLLNPQSYAFTPTSPTSIDIQINGATYNVNLDNYIQFYKDLESKNINTLAKYLNKVNNLSEEISYTKYYPSSLYEYDTRGYITINIPFNGKVVGTVKYGNELTEVSYAHNNYLGSAVILTNSQASTTQSIKRNAWGTKLLNNFDPNLVTSTNLGFTGHKETDTNNLVYMKARYFSPENKVFLSVDPVQYDSFDKQFFLINPQSQNSYSYANNDPVNNWDPTGRCATNGKVSWEACKGWYDAGKGFIKDTVQGFTTLFTQSLVTTVTNLVKSIPSIPSQIKQYNQEYTTNSKSSDPRVSANAQMGLLLGTISTIGTGGVGNVGKVGRIATSLDNIAPLAKTITNGHAFDKHILDRMEGIGNGVRTKSQFENAVFDTMKNPDKYYSGTTKELFWNDRTGMMVINNPKNPTAFYPEDGLEYYEDVLFKLIKSEK